MSYGCRCLTITEFFNHASDRTSVLFHAHTIPGRNISVFEYYQLTLQIAKIKKDFKVDVDVTLNKDQVELHARPNWDLIKSKKHQKPDTCYINIE